MNQQIKNQTTNKMIASIGLAVLLAGAGCAKSADSFSLLSESNSFQQTNSFAPRKIDILWVIDNSGSMDSSQQNLANNLQTFINRFSDKKYDFHIGVTTTDSYLATFGYNPNFAKLRDGVGTTRSGVFVIDKNTPNLIPTFMTNVKQGVNGSADERAFSSFKAALTSSANQSLGFRRDDAYLAIILVSDEEDFSHTGGAYMSESYSNPYLETVESYKTFLDTYTKSSSGLLNYSFNTIQILDSSCLATLNAQYSGRKIAQRTVQLADMTNGIKASLCGNFADSLQLISDSILENNSVFQLTREPIPETITVFVNGVLIPQSSSNGWVYTASNNTVTFKGSAIPAQGSDIRINFDPKTIKQ